MYLYMCSRKTRPRSWPTMACLCAPFLLSKAKVEHIIPVMRARAIRSAAVCALFLGILSLEQSRAQSKATVLEIGGKVEFLPANTQNWYPCNTNQPLYGGDQVRTGERSRAAVRLSDLTVFRMGERAYLRIRADQKKKSGLDLFRGLFYFFHRDNPGELDIHTPIVSAVVRGTEFNVQVAADNTTTLTVLDGEVAMTNEFGDLQLKSGEQGRAEPGKAPIKTAVIEAKNIVQWCLYYPAVLDPGELPLTDDEKSTLKDSLVAYQSGDLLAALDRYPANRKPDSPAEAVYLKALLFAVGQAGTRVALPAVVPKAEGPTAALDMALDRAASIVQERAELDRDAPPIQRKSSIIEHSFATEWMAESIARQSRHDLTGALEAAVRAREKSPQFGFAWARVAEMEFSFGRIAAAKRALETSLELSPRNAQALALMGFLVAAENRIDEAIKYFNRAIAVDGALGNAWLGRGLCRIRKGDVEAGRQDIQVAATVEPNRAAFRSYLGKAFSYAGDNRRATNELALAMELDPNDPTAWLYSALIKQQENRINESVKDFERAQSLGENRAVYRSRLLLDQDRAISGVNLATIYQDAGMADVSLREATRAVTADYATYSSHLFLANSYNALRDARQVNLRYETPAVSEYLVANLLAPVGAGILSSHVTQQEYSKLFEQDRFGFSSTTEYLSRGDWYQAASQFGTFGNSSYALDYEYRSQNGQRPNNDLEQHLASIKFKQQLTPQDSVFIQGIYADTETGDLRQLYDPAIANTDVRIKETQEPLLLLGYHREWTPNSHTLFLGGRLQDTLEVTDPTTPVILFAKWPDGSVRAVPEAFINSAAGAPSSPFEYESNFDAYTMELQQIWKPANWRHGQHTLIGGLRFQTGTFDTSGQFGDSTPFRLATTNGVVTLFQYMITNGPMPRIEEDFDRLSAYAYHNWRIAEPLVLSAGLTYDWLQFPGNFRNPPLSSDKEDIDKLSPKVGLIWIPWRDSSLRVAYSRSLGGVSFDQSFQLEPSQIAGFNQVYRSLIPESVAGAIAGAEFETWGVAFDQKFDSGTYLGAQAEWLNSEARRALGVWDFMQQTVFDPTQRVGSATTTLQELDYEERTLLFTVNQLVGDFFSLGARYRLSEADLRRDLTEVPNNLATFVDTDVQAVLHQINMFALFYHPSGFFGQFDSIWSQQSNQGYNPDIPGDDFWQFNVFAGYRFPRRQAELRVGFLNLTDQDYQLNPLNLTPELPRDRTLFLSLRFHF